MSPPERAAPKATRLSPFPGDADAWRARAGLHSAISTPPTGTDELLVWALLEAIGYNCWRYGDAPSGTTEPQARAWLRANRAVISQMRIEPPDYISLALGAYNFLREKKVRARAAIRGVRP